MTNQSGYSDFKTLWHVDKIKELREGVQPFPVHWMCSPMGQCQQNCNFCAFRMEDYLQSELFSVQENGRKIMNPKRTIPFEKMQEVLQDWQAMGVKAVTYTGGGEPLMYPNIDALLTETLEKDIQIGMITNGSLLRKSTAALLSQAHWVRVSLDSATEDTYSKLRNTSKRQFHLAIKAIELLVQKALTSDLIVAAHFVVTKENWQEVEEAAKLAKSLGVYSFRISAIFQSQPGYFEEWGKAAGQLCKETAKQQTETFIVDNNFSYRSGNTKPDYDNCWFQHLTSFLGDDLNVYRCCATSYTTQGLVGSIKGRRLIDLWKSEEKKTCFSSFDAKTCNNCSYNNKNKLLDSVIQKPHSANFV